MIEEDFVKYLGDDPEVSGIVADRIEPLTRDPNTPLPAIVYQVIDTPREESHAGPSGLAHPRIQLGCISKSYMEAKEIAKAIRFSVDGFRGSMNGRTIFRAKVDGEQDDHDSVAEEYRRIVDVVLWHREEVN